MSGEIGEKANEMLKTLCECSDCGAELYVLYVDACCDSFQITSKCTACGSRFEYGVNIRPGDV